MESDKHNIESKLRNHYEKRREEILKELSLSDADELSETAKQNNQAFDVACADVEAVSKRTKSLAAAMDKLETENKELRTELEKNKVVIVLVVLMTRVKIMT